MVRPRSSRKPTHNRLSVEGERQPSLCPTESLRHICTQQSPSGLLLGETQHGTPPTSASLYTYASRSVRTRSHSVTPPTSWGWGGRFTAGCHERCSHSQGTMRGSDIATHIQQRTSGRGEQSTPNLEELRITIRSMRSRAPSRAQGGFYSLPTQRMSSVDRRKRTWDWDCSPYRVNPPSIAANGKQSLSEKTKLPEAWRRKRKTPGTPSSDLRHTSATIVPFRWPVRLQKEYRLRSDREAYAPTLLFDSEPGTPFPA
ncbi:hypothetical protein CONLIGDRAFT_694173 [Coniochaeta ligniaria NRRL 30616]|uniref:Uncharacterized protein n=1 Tax=Coniochaeta ligniaria NRRL 30616 TaxID=1408157 RepID=A0A1J7I6Q5_9PEZI|nr:hypothetical protein CONLIGDRAFT_694173 [Coniochaeta ligniaria NRRL 30616]